MASTQYYSAYVIWFEGLPICTNLIQDNEGPPKEDGCSINRCSVVQCLYTRIFYYFSNNIYFSGPGSSVGIATELRAGEMTKHEMGWECRTHRTYKNSFWILFVAKLKEKSLRRVKA
jgi:hypothetical protein